MTTDIEPMIGAWYLNSDSDETFRVVNVDDREELIEIQHFDGDLEEIGLNDWFELRLELAEPPEDWSGPVDTYDSEDLDNGESDAEHPGAGEDSWLQ